MISLIVGSRGSGKTKAFIDLVNKAGEQELGNVVCIRKGNRYTFDLKSSVRLVDTSDFELDSYKVFYGFICGIISRDYDITHIFIGSITKVVNTDMEKLSTFLKYIEEISEKFNIKFTMTVSADPSEVPECLKKYMVEYK
jgi:hypothetical protein